MLEIDSVELSFWGKQILSGCYVNCKQGEIVGLLGRNGSGKSCLLKIIFGSLSANNKHLRIEGKLTEMAFKAGKVAYLPQEKFFPPFIKIKDIFSKISLQAGNLGNETITKLLELRVGDLSGGELRFVECLWILNHPASYILLDEPFSGLSPMQIEHVQGLIKTVGVTKGIILTDHVYRPLLEVSSRVVLMHNNSVYNIKEESDLIRYKYIPDYL